MAILNSKTLPLGMMTDDDARRVAQSTQPQSGLLSSIGRGASGLLGALGSGGSALGSALGPALSSGGSAFAQSLSASAPQMKKDILDAQRFYQMERMKSSGPVLASQLGQLNRVTPAGVVAGLPQYRAAEQAAIQQPELDRLKAEKTASGSTGTRYKYGQTIFVNKNDPKDSFPAVFDTVLKTYVRMDNGEPVGPEYKISTSAILSKGVISVQQLRESVGPLQEAENAIRQGQMFLDKIEDFEGGFDSKMGNLISDFKSFFGQELSPQELAEKASLGGQEGLLGAFRREVVGPGVLTKEDAERVMARLGGYAGDWTANPELIARAVKEVLDEKYFAYSESNQNYNFDAKSLGQRERKTLSSPTIGPPEAYYDEGGTIDMWSQLTYDQKQKVRKQYSD